MAGLQDAPTMMERNALAEFGGLMAKPVDNTVVEPVSYTPATSPGPQDVEMTLPEEIRTDDHDALALDTPLDSTEIIQPEEPTKSSEDDTIQIQAIAAPESTSDLSELNSDDLSIAPTHTVSNEVITVATSARPGQKTSAIRPHSILRPEDTVDLVNTIQTIFENDATVRDNGVILLDAPHLIPAEGDIKLPPAKYGFEATSQRVMTPAKLVGTGLVVIKHEEATLRDQRPKFQPTKELSEDEMEGIFRDHIELHGKNSKRFPYFNMDISDYRVRPEGSFELTCGSPMDKLSYIAGVNTPYGYYSRGISHFGAHVEDWHFASYNILFAGQVKLWVAVKPSSKELFESKIRELFPEIGTCVQFVRHLAINIAPSTLRKWGVEHSFVPQMPGHIVAVSGYTYHWGINTGQNYAEAINFCMEKHWVKPENFKNCYHGCGIADDMIPLPDPIWEDGDLETKKERAIERDQAFRKVWEEQAEKRVAERETPSSTKKSKPRKQRESTTLTPSDTIRFIQARVGPRLHSRDDTATPASPRPPMKVKQNDTLQDSIEVSATAQRLNVRDHRRRTTIARQRYRDASSPSEPSESTNEDEPPVKRSRPVKSSHSRHASAILEASQLDSSAVATQINGLKNMVLSFLIDQKKAASETHAKQEQLMRLHVDWQIKNTEETMKQTAYAQKMMESQQRTEHLTMLMLQRLEAQQPSRTASTTAGSSSQARHSRFSQSVGGGLASAAVPTHGTHADRRQSLSRQQFAFNTDGATPSMATRPGLDSTRSESLVNGLPEAEKASSASNVTSRAPSTMGSSTRATEEGTHTSPEYTPNTPQLKSMQSTPLADDIAPESPPSSLSDHGPIDDAAIRRRKAAETKGPQREGDRDTDMSLMSDLEENMPEEGSEYGVKGGNAKLTDQSAAASGTAGANSPSSKLKCMSCRERHIVCDREEPSCTQCITGRKTRTCVYPEPKVKSKMSRNPSKRAASEAVPAAKELPDAKRARTVPDAALGPTHPSAPRLAMSRELQGLFNTNEWGLAPDRVK